MKRIRKRPSYTVWVSVTEYLDGMWDEMPEDTKIFEIMDLMSRKPGDYGGWRLEPEYVSK